MPDIGDTPTLEDVRQWIYTLAEEWGASNTNDSYPYLSSMEAAIEREEATYFDQYDLLAPVPALAVRTGSAASDANSAIDSIMPKAALVRVKPARDRQRYKDQARKLGYFGAAALAAWRKKKDVLYALASDMVIRRVAVARIMFDSRLWPQYDQGPVPADGEDDNDYVDWTVTHRRKFPIILERRDPRFVRWREYDGDIAALVESYTTTAFEARLTWSDKPEVSKICRGMEPNQTVRVDDVWIGQYRCILLDDQPIYGVNQTGKSRVSQGVAKHGYPVIPYLIAAFRELPFDSPVKRYRGMLSDSVSLYQTEAQTLSMNLHMLAINSWRTYVHWTKDGRKLRIIPGEAIPIDKRVGEYIEMLQGEPVPPELLQFADVVDHYIQRNGVAQGPRTAEGTRSASQLWAVQAMRQMKIEGAIDNLQRLLSRALGLAAMQIETMVKEPVTLPVPGVDHDGNDLGEVTVAPKDINGYYDAFQVIFNRRLDPALLEQAKTLQVFQANHWMPKKVSWELSGLTDSPDEWNDELMIDAIDDLPFFKELLSLERAKATWGEDSEYYQLLFTKIQESHAQPPPGAGGPANLTPSSPGAGGPTAGAGTVGDNLNASSRPARQRNRGNQRRGGPGPAGPAPGGAGM